MRKDVSSRRNLDRRKLVVIAYADAQLAGVGKLLGPIRAPEDSLRKRSQQAFGRDGKSRVQQFDVRDMHVADPEAYADADSRVGATLLVLRSNFREQPSYEIAEVPFSRVSS